MSLDLVAAAALGTVRVVGTGLLGTSIGLALTDQGVRVLLDDPSPTALSLAAGLGAGSPDTGGLSARVTVIAAPPDVTAHVVAERLRLDPETTVTDVASVKAQVLQRVEDAGADLSRYVGGHPMAGRERSGPMAARGDLFVGRPWVICPGGRSDPARVSDVRMLAQAVGATPVIMGAADHDAAVAVVSHVPQVAASLVAAQLQQAPDEVLSLAGQGLRDVTRIAASDPVLWAQILAGNAEPVLDVLHRLRGDLDTVITGLGRLAAAAAATRAGDDGAPGRMPLADIAGLIHRGNEGRERIPGKHGGSPARYSVVTVVIPDRPGGLADVFAHIRDAGVNVEEIALEHAPGRAVGLLELSVVPAAVEVLVGTLRERGWKIAG